jgi:hypothetical protein
MSKFRRFWEKGGVFVVFHLPENASDKIRLSKERKNARMRLGAYVDRHICALTVGKKLEKRREIAKKTEKSRTKKIAVGEF